MLALAACSRDAAEPAPDFFVRSVAVRVDTDAPFAHQPAFPARLEKVLQASLFYWGGDWDRLAGRSLTLTSDHHVSCGGADHAAGCFDGALRVSTWDPGLGTVACVEQTVLVHEVGHAVIGDPTHQDPRWMALDLLAFLLSGQTGWGPLGETPCEIFVNVWRSPPTN
jgi:hypothetical protein